MKRFALLAILLLCGGWSHGNNGVLFNSQTLGVACNGVANDDPTFFSAGNTMRANSRVVAGANVVLAIPSGSTCLFTSCSGSYWNGLNNFTMLMAGATMSSVGGCLKLIGGGIDFTNVGGDGGVGNLQAQINTVSAGAFCVTTITASDAALYHVGRWVILGAIGLQGSGFPPNLGLFEFLQIVSVDGTSGNVCFTSPLVNSYKSTWINNGPAGCSAAACGGNPRLYPMTATWGFPVTLVGGTWQWDQLAQFVTQTHIENNVLWVGKGHAAGSCFDPSFNQNVVFNGTTISLCRVEVDKEIGNWTINGGTIDQLQIQSSSFHDLVLNNTTVSVTGVGQTVTCNNSTINTMLFNGLSFGNSFAFTGVNCNLPSITALGSNSNFCSQGFTNPQCPSLYLGSGNFQWGGTNSYPVGNPPLFYVPGTVMMFGGLGKTYVGFPYTITDNFCTGGGADTCFGGTGTLVTNLSLSSPLTPPVPADASNGQVGLPDPLRNWSCSNCTGSPAAIDLSQASAQNQPLYTYTNRTYTCAGNVPHVPGSIDINVGTAGWVLGLF